MDQNKDQFSQFKATQREGWALFAPLEAITTPPAAKIVKFAKVNSAEKVLDVGCGTGVVAVTAALKGAKVSALDLSPVLLEKAYENAKIAGVEIDFTEGDVEYLPYKDATFDVVMSQFGHMFAPRPEVAISEMLRVLKPGGTIVFSTWPPEMYTGQMFSLIGKYLPPPEGVAPPPLWGEPTIIRQRLGNHVKDIFFDRQVMQKPCLSLKHARVQFELTAGPMVTLAKKLSKENPSLLEDFRSQFEKHISKYLKGNILRMHYLMTRATKN